MTANRSSLRSLSRYKSPIIAWHRLLALSSAVTQTRLRSVGGAVDVWHWGDFDWESHVSDGYDGGLLVSFVLGLVPCRSSRLLRSWRAIGRLTAVSVLTTIEATRCWFSIQFSSEGTLPMPDVVDGLRCCPKIDERLLFFPRPRTGDIAVVLGWKSSTTAMSFWDGIDGVGIP